MQLASKVHYCLKDFRDGRGDGNLLADLQETHQRLFMQCWEGHERPKHHYRLHHPQQFREHGYMDCWCLEKKHQRYKAMLADSLQSLWEEGSGALSRQICGRMLHSTVVDLAVLRVGAAALTGKIHGEEAVFQLTGARAKVAATVEVGSLTIKQFEVILWETVGATYAGKVQFFAEVDGHILIIYECLIEQPSSVPFTKKFHCDGEKRAQFLDQMEAIAHPTWWAQDGSSLTCLL